MNRSPFHMGFRGFVAALMIVLTLGSLVVGVLLLREIVDLFRMYSRSTMGTEARGFMGLFLMGLLAALGIAYAAIHTFWRSIRCPDRP